MSGALLTVAGNLCQVHGYHYPTPARTVRHHIVPQSYGGPTTAGNLVLVCDTGHASIHEYIDTALKGRRWTRRITRRERELAEQGLAGIRA